MISSQNSNGTCKVKFVVGANGKVTEVEATSMKGTELAKVAVAAVKNGPDWIAGTQNGRAVASFVEQPVSFRINDELIRGNPKVLDR